MKYPDAHVKQVSKQLNNPVSPSRMSVQKSGNTSLKLRYELFAIATRTKQHEATPE